MRDKEPEDGSEMSFAEIGRQMGLCRETIRKEYYSAIKKLRRELDREKIKFEDLINDMK